VLALMHDRLAKVGVGGHSALTARCLLNGTPAVRAHAIASSIARTRQAGAAGVCGAVGAGDRRGVVRVSIAPAHTVMVHLYTGARPTVKFG
jgi:hypothetical protein